MNQFLHLLKHDFRLLQRHKILAISILVTAIYIAVFKALSHFSQADRILVLVIFNDPALLGFLFVGVMVLFEKNENTLQALSVSPLKESNYIFSKTIALSVISVICCYAMAFAGMGLDFHFGHYFFASLFTSNLFAFLGFIIVAGVTSFNRFLMKAVGLLITLSIPFLGYYGVLPRVWFLWMPTQPCIDLFRAAFYQDVTSNEMLYAYVAMIFWLIVTGLLAIRTFRKNFKS
jgi:fluoroquinolone transport system permease protein